MKCRMLAPSRDMIWVWPFAHHDFSMLDSFIHIKIEISFSFLFFHFCVRGYEHKNENEKKQGGRQWPIRQIMLNFDASASISSISLPAPAPTCRGALKCCRPCVPTQNTLVGCNRFYSTPALFFVHSHILRSFETKHPCSHKARPTET